VVAVDLSDIQTRTPRGRPGKKVISSQLSVLSFQDKQPAAVSAQQSARDSLLNQPINQPINYFPTQLLFCSWSFTHHQSLVSPRYPLLVTASRLPTVFSTQRTPAPPALCNLVLYCISRGEVILVVILLRGNEPYELYELFHINPTNPMNSMNSLRSQQSLPVRCTQTSSAVKAFVS